MTYISSEEIENISKRVYRAYTKLPEVSEHSFNVDPELLSEMLGLTIEYRHLSSDRTILGLTSFEETWIEVFDSPCEEMLFLDGKTILIEQDLLNDPQMPGRLNFTIVHEACHHIMNMLFPKDSCRTARTRKVLAYRSPYQTRYIKPLEEILIDKMTSAVLMPEELVRSNMLICGLPAEMDMINRIWRPKNYERFELLSQMMGVSKQALAIRLKSLGIVKEEHLKHPNEITNIYMPEEELRFG